MSSWEKAPKRFDLTGYLMHPLYNNSIFSKLCISHNFKLFCRISSKDLTLYIQTVIVKTWTQVWEHSKWYLWESYLLLNSFLHMSISPSGPLSCPNHTTSVNKNHELFTCRGIFTHENKTLRLIFFCINLKEIKTVLCFKGYGAKRTG